MKCLDEAEKEENGTKSEQSDAEKSGKSDEEESDLEAVWVLKKPVSSHARKWL